MTERSRFIALTLAQHEAAAAALRAIGKPREVTVVMTPEELRDAKDALRRAGPRCAEALGILDRAEAEAITERAEQSDESAAKLGDSEDGQ